MSWTTFPTLTDGQVLTGAHMQIVQADFAETAPAKASQDGQIFAATGVNTIAARRPDFATVGTSQTTTSTSYTNLTTTGPVLSITTGTRMLVIFGCQLANDTTGANSYMSYDGAGVTASDSYALQHRGNANDAMQAVYTHFLSGITPGAQTFTAKYRVSSGIGTFQDRRIQVVPF